MPASGAVRLRRGGDLQRRARRQLRRGATRPRSSSVPFKWYPGSRVLTQAFLWRLLDLTEADGRPIDLSSRRSSPPTSSVIPNKARLARAPVPAGLRLDRTELGQFGESPEDRAVRRQVQRARPRGTRRGAASCSRPRGTSPGGSSAPPGSSAEVLPQPPQRARLPGRRPGRLRALRRPARPREADRPARRGGGARRRRSASSSPVTAPTASGSSGWSAEPGSTAGSSSPAASPRRSSPTCTRSCLAVLLRAGRRGLRDGAVRGVSLRQARDHGDRRRRAARGRPRPARPAVVVAPERRRGRRGVRVACATTRTRRRPGAGRARRSPSEVTWDDAIDRLLS